MTLPWYHSTVGNYGYKSIKYFVRLLFLNFNQHDVTLCVSVAS